MELSAREREVLSLVAEGLERSIARKLFVTERTVEAHVSQIFLKLHIDEDATRIAAVLAVVAFLAERGARAPTFVNGQIQRALRRRAGSGLPGVRMSTNRTCLRLGPRRRKETPHTYRRCRLRSSSPRLIRPIRHAIDTGPA